MSASTNVLWRGLRGMLQGLRLVAPRPHTEAAPAPVAVVEPAPTKLTATIEIVALIDHIREEDFIPIMVEPIAPVIEAVRPVSMPHPIARQLAYTASRNVPKGRKAHPAPMSVSSGQRKISPIKAKPVIQNTVKKAPKRRHVWLCNQSRVVRPISANVVPLNAARTRAVQKPGSQKTIRLLKLAA